MKGGGRPTDACFLCFLREKNKPPKEEEEGEERKWNIFQE